ncbi:ribbon-helix-helix domain-containing protein [Brevundimonas fluminis]|jgi:predicted DNA-binding ribbon-helix-helix protein|uniref:ribbon-helix-helix domain-containing protein n=1 Tax=Brevundimonas fluminis TaxID=2487274 RepID=UPI000F65731A|nr:ribbon-helix-helix domain-containing protein [Brevundimonas fluminis]
MLRKRSVLLSGHATSVALEPEFWAVLDGIATEMSLPVSGLMKRIDQRRGRTPLASACRLLALAWASGDRRFADD